MISYILWLLSVLVLPFFQGGYFHYQVFAFGLIQGIVVIYQVYNFNKSKNFKNKDHCLLIKKNFGIFDSKVFLLLGFLTIIAGITSLWAIDRGIHFFGVLRLIGLLIFLGNYILFYKQKGDKLIVHVKYTLIASGSLASLFSLLVVLFTSSSGRLLEHLMQNQRFGGVFQYANTYGIYLIGCFVILLTLKEYKKYQWIVGLLLLSNIYMTQSRGVLLSLAIVVIALIIISKSNRKVIMYSLLGLFVGRISLGQIKVIEDLTRGVDFAQNTSEWLSRLVYYKDGLTLIASNIFGVGYGGYYYIQGIYQSGANYSVRFIHSSLLQLAIDYGLLAMVSWLAFGGLAIYYALKKSLWKNSEDSRILLIGSLALYGHSLIDFDLQFSMCFLMFLILLINLEIRSKSFDFNIENTRDKASHNIDRLKKASWLCYGLVSLIILLNIFFVYYGTTSYLEYNGEYEKAFNINPSFSTNNHDILRKKLPGISLEEKSLIAQKAVEQNEYFYPGFAFLREYHYNNGDFKNASDAGEKCALLRPLDLNKYERYLSVTWSYVYQLYVQGELDDDNVYLEELTNIAHYVKELENTKKNNYNIKHKVTFELSDEMYNIEKQAKYLKNKLNGDDYEN